MNNPKETKIILGILKDWSEENNNMLVLFQRAEIAKDDPKLLSSIWEIAKDVRTLQKKIDLNMESIAWHCKIVREHGHAD